MASSEPVVILGGVLAGGLSRRMGGSEKCLLELGGQTLLGRIVERLSPQVNEVVINANDDPSRFKFLENTIVPDIVGGHAGPLAGIHALIDHALNSQIPYTHVASVAGDTPFFPFDFVDECVNKIRDGAEYGTVVIAKSGGLKHPVFGLWPISLFGSLSEFLQRAETRKVMAFVNLHPCEFADFALNRVKEPADPFFNINSPLDMNEACAIISRTNTELRQ